MSEDDIFEVGRKTIYWGIAIFIITSLMIAFVIIIVGYQDRLTKVPAEIKAELIALRFVNNPDCFAYQDSSTKRVYPHTIDLAKFTSERMNNCYQTEEPGGYKTFNFKLTLHGTGSSIKTNNYFNVPHFDVGLAVIVWDGKGFFRDQLLVQVQEKLPVKPT